MKTGTADIDSLSVRLATESDLPLILEILTEGATWQSSQHEAVWPVPFPEGTVRPSMDRQETYVLTQHDAVIGTVALCWEDELFWGKQPPDAGYVHRLAVPRHASGAGFGAAMLAWADETIAAVGRTWLRLDCPTANQGLRSYYERQSFEVVRDVEILNSPEFGTSVDWHLALHQRRVIVASAPG